MPGSFFQESFPNLWFAWFFYAALVCILVIASYFDLRYLTIPKPVSLTCLGLGLTVNLARGVWIGIDHDNWILGLLDGFLFSLGGFATGFAIFFSLWILGLCGGGDVKLFAAASTWIGWKYSFWLWVGSVFALAIVAIIRLFLHTLIAGVTSTRRSFFAKGNNPGKGKGPAKPRRRLLPYSLPLAIAAGIMLLWIFRKDLHLERPETPDGNAMTSIHP